MKLIIFAFGCFLLSACSTRSDKFSTVKSVNEKIHAQHAVNKNNTNKEQITKDSSDNSMHEDQLLFYLLRNSFSKWQGTPYRLGGNSKHGIDCSAFIKNVFAESFNISLPRTTKYQSEEGYLVYRDELEIGDLVFFKTGWNIRHVGIYMGNNEFIHASTSRGVITSSLDNSYWTSKYWQARRVLD